MVMAQTYNPCDWEGGAGRLPRDFKTTSGYKVSSRPAWAKIRSVVSCLQACNLSTVEAEAGRLVKIQDRSALIGESQASLSYRAISCFKKSQNQEAQQWNTCGKKIEGTIEGRKRTCQRSGGKTEMAGGQCMRTKYIFTYV